MEVEEKITEMEVKAILDKILDLGDGDIIDGTIKAVEAGVLDSPWSPNMTVKDKVLGVRDAQAPAAIWSSATCLFPKRSKISTGRK